MDWPGAIQQAREMVRQATSWAQLFRLLEEGEQQS